MKRKLLKTLTSLLLATLMVVSLLPALALGTSAAETTASFDFSAQGYTNQTKITSVEIGEHITATFDKGTNSNVPQYYTKGTAVRLYGGGTITITAAEGYTIKKITFTYGSSDGSNDITADVGTFTSPDWEGSANSVTFTVGGTSGNRRFQIISVAYEAEVSESGHTHDYAWDGNVGADGSHTLSCNAEGTCNAQTKTEDCTWTEGACSVCGAIEPTHEITFSVPTGLTAPETVSCPTAGVKLPELPVADGYIAIGWAQAAIVGSADEEPATFAVGETYTATTATTLYAVYALAEEVSGDTIYVKVSADEMVEGTYYLAAQKSSTATDAYYFATGKLDSGDLLVTTNDSKEIDGSLSSLPEGAIALTFTGDNTNGYTISKSDGTYLGVSDYENSRRLAFSSDYSSIIWTIHNSDNSVNAGKGIYINNAFSTGDYAVSENSTGDAPIRGYKSGTDYRPIYLFKETTGTSITYTYYTNFAAGEHVCENLTEHPAVTAGCETEGNSAYWECACGKFYSDAAALNEIEANSWIIEASHTANAEGTTCTVCSAALYNKVTDISTLKDGDGIVIYYPAGGLLISETASEKKLTGVSATVNNNTVGIVGGGELFLIVHKDANGNFFFETEDGKFLTTGATGGSLTLEASATEYSKWRFDTTGSTATLRIFSVGANYNGNYNQAIEYYYGFTTYGAKDTEIYNFEIYQKQGYSNPIVAPEFTGFSLTLNKGVTVNVKVTVDAAWLAANPGAKIVFSNDTAIALEAGKDTYTVDLNPTQIKNSLTAALQFENGTGIATKDVSVNGYLARVKELGKENVTNYDAIVALLNSIIAYGEAANKGGSTLTETFENVGDAVSTGDIFVTAKATLAEQASIHVKVQNFSDTCTFGITVGGKELVAKRNLKDALEGGSYITINGLYPANFNDEIVITIYEGENTAATLTFTFNAYLKTLYGASTDEATKNLIAATYKYGVAAEALAS